MAIRIFSVTLEDLKQNVHEFGLEGKDRTKFLKKDGKKMQETKLAKEKARFEREVERERLEQKRLDSEKEEKRSNMEAEERRWKERWKQNG